MNCKWLPELLPCNNWAEFAKYDQIIYEVFKNDFIYSQPSFRNLKVKIRRQPMECGKEQAYFHITSKEYVIGQERCPDPKRCERIKWVRAFIENYICDPAECGECSGIKIWGEPYKANTRVHILLEEENYMVIVEVRPTYALLITAFYFDYQHSLEKQLQKYRAAKAGR